MPSVFSRPYPHHNYNDITLEQRTDQTSVKKYGLTRVFHVFGKKSKIVIRMRTFDKINYLKIFFFFIVTTCKKL